MHASGAAMVETAVERHGEQPAFKPARSEV